MDWIYLWRISKEKFAKSKSNITNSNLSLKDQYEEEVKILNKKWPNAKHIIYFQTGSNTYMNINIFKNNVESLLKYKNVICYKK